MEKIRQAKVSYTEITLISIFSIFLIAIPFYRGLFFRENYIPSIIAIGVMFIAILFLKYKEKRLSLIESYIDIGVLGLAFAYFISFFVGISKMDAFDGLLKYAAAFMFFKISAELCRENTGRRIILKVFVFSGFTTAFISMLGGAGIINVGEVFGFGDRLTGLYQYPNATASVLGALFLLSIILSLDVKHKGLRLLYFIASATIVVGFLMTKSRGGILVLGIAWLIAIILLRNKNKLYFIINSILSAVPALVLYSKIYNSVLQKNGFLLAYLMLIAGAIAAALIARLFSIDVEKIKDRAVTAVLLGMAALFIIAAIVAFSVTEPLTLSAAMPQTGYEIYTVQPEIKYAVDIMSQSTQNIDRNLTIIVNSVDKSRARTQLASQAVSAGVQGTDTVEFSTLPNTQYITIDFVNNNPANSTDIAKCTIRDLSSGKTVENMKLKYKFLPQDIGKKLSQINLKTESSSERMVFVRDGLRMFGDNVLLGTGHKGWNNLYTKYQSYAYISKETHNYYLQVAIETGIVGIVFIATILISLIIALFKLYAKKQDDRNIVSALIVMSFMLLFHVAIDFDFSLYALFLLFIAIAGMISGMAKENGILSIRQRYSVPVAVCALILAVAITAISGIMSYGIANGNKGAQIITTNAAAAKPYYEKALGKDFYNVMYLVDYSQIISLEGKKTGNTDLLKQAYNNYKKVEKIDPYKLSCYSAMLNFYISNGLFEDANRLLNRLIDIQPLKPVNYELKADVNNFIMNKYIENGDYKSALVYANNVLEVETLYKNANAKTIAPFNMTDKNKQILADTKTKIVEIQSKLK